LNVERGEFLEEVTYLLYLSSFLLKKRMKEHLERNYVIIEKK